MAKKPLDNVVSFVEVPWISTVGEYHFARIGNRDGKKDTYGIPADSIYSPSQPNFRWGAILSHLNESFPEISAERFIPGCSSCGEGAKLMPETDWSSIFNGELFLNFNEANYRVNSSAYRSTSYDRQEFRIQDIGKIILRKQDKKLIITENRKRNGDLSLIMQGCEPGLAKMKGIPAFWKALVSYTGNSPGELFDFVVDYINSEKARLNSPLWRKEE